MFLAFSKKLGMNSWGEIELYVIFLHDVITVAPSYAMFFLVKGEEDVERLFATIDNHEIR